MRLKIALSVLALCCIAGIAFAQTAPNAQRTGAMGAAATDDRQHVPVTPATREIVLAEMRKMLAAA